MKITTTNRLAVLIRERQMGSASEFGRRMTAAGYPMSSSHASRYEKGDAPAFDQKFVNVACNVLQCLPNELYRITVELDPREELDPLVILPRHAIVIRREITSDTKSHLPIDNGAQAQTWPAPSPTSATRIKISGKGGAKPAAPADDDAGPSGSVFPFLKD